MPSTDAEWEQYMRGYGAAIEAMQAITRLPAPEIKIAKLRSELAAATQRAEAAEAELATLRRYADDADKSTMERIARIEAAEAAYTRVTAAYDEAMDRAEAAEAERDRLRAQLERLLNDDSKVRP